MSIGFWLSDDMKGRELTAKDYRHIYEQATGYDRAKVDTLLGDLLYEIEKKKMLLATVEAAAVREDIQQAITDLQERRNEIQRLHREDQGGAHRALMGAFTLWIQRQMKAQEINDFTDDEARLATYLMQQGERGRPLSFRDIAEAEGCSAMAIKRRVDSLRKQHKAFSNWLERNIPRKPGRPPLQKPNKTKKD